MASKILVDRNMAIKASIDELEIVYNNKRKDLRIQIEQLKAEYRVKHTQKMKEMERYWKGGE